MIEKKYMTASEIANRMANLNVEYNITKKSKVVDKTYKDKYIPELKKEYHKLENELTTKFINKEELIDKIKNMTLQIEWQIENDSADTLKIISLSGLHSGFLEVIKLLEMYK